jgi:hypothetical protein
VEEVDIPDMELSERLGKRRRNDHLDNPKVNTGYYDEPSSTEDSDDIDQFRRVRIVQLAE